MTFSQKFDLVRQLHGSGSLLDAASVYFDLVKTNREEVLERAHADIKSKLRHYEFARQFAIQKILIQRMRGVENITLDLSQFTHKLPLTISYGKEAIEALAGWKGDCASFEASKSIFQKSCVEIFNRKLRNHQPPAIFDADVYFAIWVVGDFLELESALFESTAQSYVNLGCGAGMFDAAYLRTRDTSMVESYLVDIDSDVLSGAEAVLRSNSIGNARCATHLPNTLTNTTDVISVRSCSFLYSVTGYEELFRSLVPGSRAILTVNERYAAETDEFFSDIGTKRIVHRETQTDGKLIEYRYL